MKFFRIVCTLLLLFGFIASTDMSAKGSEEKKLYVFGYGLSLKDSTVFLTPIVEFPIAEQNKKTKFLDHQAEYAKQMESFLHAQGIPFCTCVLFYDNRIEKLQKRLNKLREHTIKEEKFSIQNLNAEQFSFSLMSSSNQSAQP